MRLKTIVIDDEPLASQLIESYVCKTPFLEHIATFSTAIEALNSEALKCADLLFLDIQMPNLTGLEFSRMVNPRTRIVFTTAFNQYALDGYRVNALDYLLKPISYSDFLESAQRAVEWFTQRGEGDNKDSIFVKSDYKLIRIELRELIYVEGLKDYVKFMCDGKERSIISLMNIKRAEELLPSEQFIRVHRSFIVRKDKIKVIERSHIIFDNERIPIGDSYKAALQEYIKEFS